jgi:flagella basal body P-ring formation protein FlgA
VLDKNVTLSPRLIQNGAPNQAKVRVSVLADSNEIGAGVVTFRLKFNCRTAVTLTEIPAGSVISPESVKIEKILSDYPEPAHWSPPYGLIARRSLSANTVIQPDMVGLAKPAVSIKRNETVVIRIEMPGLLVTALGKAMQQGRAGECIKVRNIDSQQIIVAKVNEDGTVEPIF